MRNLAGLTYAEIDQLVHEEGMPRFTAKQITDWLYVKRVDSIDQMTNLSKKHREQLSHRYQVGLTPPLSKQISKDGTIKYLFKTESGALIESVYIPDRERATLCVSSQAGCRMGCGFCATGLGGFQGQLSSTEIINQIISIPESEQLTNIVYMGMGEPMDNINAVLKSLEILTSEWGFAWSPKRITVSSVGLLIGLKRLLTESQVHVAISLHNPFAKERKMIMPAEKSNPLDDILELLSGYDFAHQRRLSFEYTLLEGVNDTDLHAQELSAKLKPISCRVNLIPYHQVPNADILPSNKEQIDQFCKKLNRSGINCTIRTSRGEDIAAACGLLSTERKNTK